MKYVLDGNPIPLARGRISCGRIYDSQKQHKLAYGILLQHQHNGKPLFDKPLHLEATFYFKIPLSQMNRMTSKSSSNKRFKGEGVPHSIRPDLDNVVKFLLDCCNGVIYRDDCLVASMKIEKVYSENPRTEFDLWEI